MSGRPSAGELTERAATLLRARGDRMTAPRRAVLTALAAHPTHLSADQVVTAVARIDSAVHRASVYRALEALTDIGIVQHVHVSHGTTAYHLAGAQVHLHAQCESCGAVIDLATDLLDAVRDRVEAEQAFRIDPSHVALSGTCNRCRATGVAP